VQAAGAHGSGVGGQGGQHGWITPHLQGRVCTCPPARSYMQAAHGGRHSHGACHGPRAPGRDEALASRHGTPTVSALRCIVQGHSLFLICCAASRCQLGRCCKQNLAVGVRCAVSCCKPGGCCKHHLACANAVLGRIANHADVASIIWQT